MLSVVFPVSYDRETYTNIQRALNELTWQVPGRVALKADGQPGPLTFAMVKVAQGALELPVTGVFEGELAARVFALIEERFLKDSDIRELAEQYNLEYAMLKAICVVEAQGFGFLTNTRAKILFERHKFHQELLKVKPRAEVLALAKANPDILNTSPGGYLGNEREWARLEKAMHIDLESALRAASWGLGQVMGFHWQRLGYASAFDMFRLSMMNERNQIEMLVRYCTSDPAILIAMKNKNFATIARLYNGPNYAINKYDVKLAREYARYA